MKNKIETEVTLRRDKALQSTDSDSSLYEGGDDAKGDGASRAAAALKEEQEKSVSQFGNISLTFYLTFICVS